MLCIEIAIPNLSLISNTSKVIKTAFKTSLWVQNNPDLLVHKIRNIIIKLKNVAPKSDYP